MTAATAKIEREVGFDRLHCPACGHTLLLADDGLSEDLCEHVVGVIDWIGEPIAGRGAYAGAVEEVVDQWREGQVEDCAGAWAARLPASAVVLELIEPGRGGGHDGETIIVAIDFGAGD